MKAFIISLVLLCCTQLSSAQKYEFRGYLGSTYYQGDLAPVAVLTSFSNGRTAWSVLAGVKLSESFQLNTRIMVGQLGASDSDSRKETRIRRNLSFDTPLYEFGVTLEFNLNKWMKFLDNYGLRLYTTTGINAFHFNPQTIYQGRLVALQPLGTEGQGLSGYGNYYSLTQINLSLGMGVSFKLSKQFSLGIEWCTRPTFTDYLDDVSGGYVNYNELLEAGRPLAAELANRTHEITGSDNISVPTGTARGNPENNDWYFFLGISLGYHFGFDTAAEAPVEAP